LQNWAINEVRTSVLNKSSAAISIDSYNRTESSNGATWGNDGVK
jgi:hypothetical protein